MTLHDYHMNWNIQHSAMVMLDTIQRMLSNLAPVPDDFEDDKAWADFLVRIQLSDELEKIRNIILGDRANTMGGKRE